MSHLETERQASVCGPPSCKTRVGCVHMYTVLEVGCVPVYITFVSEKLLYYCGHGPSTHVLIQHHVLPSDPGVFLPSTYPLQVCPSISHL